MPSKGDGRISGGVTPKGKRPTRTLGAGRPLTTASARLCWQDKEQPAKENGRRLWAIQTGAYREFCWPEYS